MPRPDGSKGPKYFSARFKELKRCFHEVTDPDYQAYKEAVKDGRYNPKDHIHAFSAEEAKIKGWLADKPSQLDLLLDRAPTERQVQKALKNGEPLAIPDMSEAPAQVPNNRLLPGEEI